MMVGVPPLLLALAAPFGVSSLRQAQPTEVG